MVHVRVLIGSEPPSMPVSTALGFETRQLIEQLFEMNLAVVPILFVLIIWLFLDGPKPLSSHIETRFIQPLHLWLLHVLVDRIVHVIVAEIIASNNRGVQAVLLDENIPFGLRSEIVVGLGRLHYLH